MLCNEITIGRLPSVLFAIMVLLSIGVCGTFLWAVRLPPTIFVREAIGTVMIDPASYDAAYHEAIARRFLNLYGNYNYHNYIAKNWWASRMMDAALQRQVMYVAQRNEETVATFAMTRTLKILDHRLEWEDSHAGRSVHAFRVLLRDFYGAAEHDRHEAWYVIEVQATMGTDVTGDVGAYIIALAYYPIEQDAVMETDESHVMEQEDRS